MKEMWANKISLTVPLFNEMPVPSQTSERSDICLLGVHVYICQQILRSSYEIVELF
jgi:hypothetical protein